MSKFLIKKTNTGYKFTLHAKNGQEIGTSQVYKAMAGCKNGIKSVKNNAIVADDEDQTNQHFQKKACPKFVIYTDKAGEIRFRLIAKNGQIILSSEGYKTKKSCKNGIASVKKNAPDAPVELKK